MNDEELDLRFEALRKEILGEIRPPRWEPWALVGSFLAGVLVGAFVGPLLV